jgi:hypothetical protein
MYVQRLSCELKSKVRMADLLLILEFLVFVFVSGLRGIFARGKNSSREGHTCVRCSELIPKYLPMHCKEIHITYATSVFEQNLSAFIGLRPSGTC